MNYVTGIDVSKWQGNMDWQKAYQNGARFAFIRAGSITNTTGECYKDSKFEQNAATAPAIMPIGYYFYMRPNHDAVKQADYFWSLIKNKDYRLPLVIDIEDPGGEPQRYIQKRLKLFAERITNHAQQPPIIYTSSGFANPFLGNADWLSSYDLWIASWTTYLQPTLPRAWSSWLFWQWSGDGNGLGRQYGAESRSIDLNRFNGGEQDFALFCDGDGLGAAIGDAVYFGFIQEPEAADRQREASLGFRLSLHHGIG